MSDRKDGSGEKQGLLAADNGSKSYGGTPVEPIVEVSETGSGAGSRPGSGAGSRPGSGAGSRGGSGASHSSQGSRPGSSIDKTASFEQGILYSPSYEKIRAMASANDDDAPSCCIRNPRLLVAALGFFVVMTTVLVIVIILMATGTVVIGMRSSDATLSAGSLRASAVVVPKDEATPNTLPLLASVFDFEQHAQKVLDPSAWQYFSSGATEEITLRDNVEAYRRLRIRPNREVDVSTAATSLNVSTFGGTVSIPIGFSPTASHWWANKESEIGTVRAAESLNTVMIVSIDATTMTTDIAAAVPGALLWQQMYIFGDEKDTRYMIDLAEKSSCKALVLTIDKPAPTIRYPALRGQITYPADYPTASNYPPNMGANSGYYKKRNWEEIFWLTQQTKLPVIVKGVLTAPEARQAINHGASGILVSNHGGRALDGVPATIDQLTEIVAEVKGQVPVYIDGGIRTGIDVFKALALGADMVFVGRPVLWGLAYDGQRGVEKVINILNDELVNTMELAGTANLTAINPNYIYHHDTMAACTKV